MRIARRPRDFVGVRGPDAASYLQAMVSNDVEALGIGDSCEALLLTAKARVIAPLVVLRRGVDDFLLLTEDGLGERVRSTLLRSRFAAKCEIAVGAAHVVGRPRRERRHSDDGLRRACRARSSTRRSSPRSTTPSSSSCAYARGRRASGTRSTIACFPPKPGSTQRAVDFEKGCYPGQEPIARQHYRGRVNRTLRVLQIDGEELPEYDAELELEGKVVGRVTSAARDGDGIVALGYVRVEVPGEAVLRLGTRSVRQLDLPSPRP